MNPTQVTWKPAEEPSPLSPCLHGEIVIPPSEALPVPMLTPTLSYADWLALGNQPLPDMTPDTTPAPMTLEETKENIMRLLTDGTYSFHPEEVRALSSCLHHLETAKRDSERKVRLANLSTPMKDSFPKISEGEGVVLDVCETMPRWDCVDDKWVQRKFGTMEYEKALFEDIIVFYDFERKDGAVIRVRRTDAAMSTEKEGDS